LEWKEYPESWEEHAKQMVITTATSSHKGKVRGTAADLNPGTTYCVRLRGIYTQEANKLLKPGPELIIDTEQVSCTPKSSCMLM